MTRVLLIDDDEGNRLTLGALLEDEGLDVDVAGSFAQGRAKLCDGAAPYDIVLLDLHLGDGLGTSLLPTVRARMPSAKVLLISGSAGEDDLPRDAALDGVLAKGGDVDDILAMMNAVLAPGAGRS